MSDLSPELEQDISPGGHPPTLELLSARESSNDPYGPFFNAEKVYPDFNFSLHERRLIGGVIEATPQSRLSHCLGQLSEKCGGEFTVFSEPMQKNNQFGQANKWLRGSSPSVKRLGYKHRQEIIKPAVASDAVIQKIVNNNHPVAQLLSLVKAECVGDEKMTKDQFTILKADLLTVTHWSDLKENYERQIAQREAEKIGSGLHYIFRYILPIHGV